MSAYPVSPRNPVAARTARASPVSGRLAAVVAVALACAGCVNGDEARVDSAAVGWLSNPGCVRGLGAVLAPAAGDAQAEDCAVVGVPDWENAAGEVTGAVLRIGGPEASPVWIRASSERGGRFGSAVASAANGRLVAVGAPWSTNGGVNRAGSVEILDGGTGAIVFAHRGIAAGDRLGSSVAWVGDLDGDGTPDLSAWSRGSSADGRSRGRVTVLSGVSGAVLLSVSGEAGEQFGLATCGVDDLDSDGLPDIAVSAPSASQSDADARGRVVLLSGGDGAILKEWWGDRGHSGWGMSICAVDDEDGDRLRDIAIGSPWCGDEEAPERGRVAIVSSQTGELLREWWGESPREHLGASLTLLDDLDGDGVSDLAIGAPGLQAPERGTCGGVFVVSPRTGEEHVRILGVRIDGFLGRTVCAVRDLDGDGRRDLLAGSPGEAADPGLPGGVWAFSSSSGELLWQIVPEEGEKVPTRLRRRTGRRLPLR